MIPKCKYCGKEYKLNTWEFLPSLSPMMQEKLKYIPDCDCLDKEAEKELEKLEKERVRQCNLNRIKKYKDISIIDQKFETSTFEKSDMMDKHMQVSKKFAENFVKKGSAPTGIMFFGSVGTGKTYASSCIANYLMDNLKTVLVMNLSRYINKLQREWAEAEKDVMSYVETCDLLVVDDFGVEKASEFVIEKTFGLIDTRYRTKKPMIITTNLNMQDIEIKFGSRIADRIKEMCFPLPVIGISKRGTNTKDAFLEFIA